MPASLLITLEIMLYRLESTDIHSKENLAENVEEDLTKCKVNETELNYLIHNKQKKKTTPDNVNGAIVSPATCSLHCGRL